MSDERDYGGADLLLDAVRIEADTPGPVGREMAIDYREVARSPVPNPVIGAGGELAEFEGGRQTTSIMVKTLDRPDYVAAQASQTRLELAKKAGALALGLDVADTIKAENSAEQMLAHQMAAAHASAIAMANGRCRMHGGASTGPRTMAGLERSRKARWKHGHYSAEAVRERQDARLAQSALRQLLAIFR